MKNRSEQIVLDTEEVLDRGRVEIMTHGKQKQTLERTQIEVRRFSRGRNEAGEYERSRPV